MADVFISYARADREKVERLAAALETEGLSVWWDRQIVGGAEFSAEIEKALDASSAVLVAWSAAGNVSSWVKDEATRGRSQGKLVPALLDGAGAPMGFGQYQAVDLSKWTGSRAASEFQDLLRALKARSTTGTSAAAAPAKPAPEPRAPNRSLIAAGIAGVAALIAAAIFVLRPFDARSPRADDSPDEQTTATSQADQSAATGVAKSAPSASIAVLPFADMSAEKNQEYFADGMAEEILNVLAKIQGLKVSGRTSSFSFKGKNEDLREIGAALGVAHILEGSVRKQGDRVRITAQLVRTDDGFHVWSETFDRDLKDVFAVQDEIAKAIADELSVELGAAAQATDTNDPEAHDLYLRARQLLAMRSADSMRQAIDLFRAATILDPNYAAAHSGLGRTWSLLIYFDDKEDVAAAMAKAEAAAKRALELDPRDAEAHATLSQIHWYQTWNWDAADAEMRLAASIAPNDAEIVNFLGDHYRRRGDLDRAEAFELRATELNPLMAINFSDFGFVELMRGKCGEALDATLESIRLDRSQLTGWGVRMSAEICLGRMNDAATSLAELQQLSPDSIYTTAARGAFGVVRNDRDEIEAALTELRKGGRSGFQTEYALASLLADIGRNDEAAQALETAYQKRDVLFVLDDRRLIAEDWPDDPQIRAALDKPELNALYAIRRENLKRHPLPAPP